MGSSRPPRQSPTGAACRRLCPLEYDCQMRQTLLLPLIGACPRPPGSTRRPRLHTTTQRHCSCQTRRRSGGSRQKRHRVQHQGLSAGLPASAAMQVSALANCVVVIRCCVFRFHQGKRTCEAGSLARRTTADPPSEAPLQTIGSYVAAAQEARERTLLVSAAQVRLQHEASLWRRHATPKRTITAAANGQVR